MLEDAVVVGSGMGGLCVALALAKRGLKPLVFEKNPRVGGSFGSYGISGYQVDTGCHLLTRGRTGELPFFLRKYVDRNVFEKYFKVHHAYNFILGDLTAKLPGNLIEILRFKILPLKERLMMLRMIFDFLRMGREGTAEYKGLSVYDYIQKYIGGEQSFWYMNAMCYMSTGANIYRGAISRFVDTHIRSRKLTLQYFFKHLSPGAKSQEEDYYPIGGLIKVPEMMMEAGDLRVKTRTEVKRIEIVNREVLGVETADGNFHETKLVVYDGLVNRLPDLLPRNALRKSEREHYRSLREYHAVTVWCGFKETVAHWHGESHVHVNMDLDPPQWGLFTTDFDPSLAPKGRQLLGVSTIYLEEKDRKDQINKIEDAIELMVPNYEKKLDMKHIQLLLAEKALQTAGNSIWQLPKQKTSIRGLYITGTDTAGWGNGGTLCADSAMSCLRYIEEDFDLKKTSETQDTE